MLYIRVTQVVRGQQVLLVKQVIKVTKDFMDHMVSLVTEVQPVMMAKMDNQAIMDQ